MGMRAGWACLLVVAGALLAPSTVDNITAVFVAEYTDPEGLTGSDQVVLRQTG